MVADGSIDWGDGHGGPAGRDSCPCRQAEDGHAVRPQSRVDRTRASPLARDHPLADLRRRRVRARLSEAVVCRGWRGRGTACVPEIDMSTDTSLDRGPDLTQGVTTETLADGKMLAGHVGEDAVLLARRGDEYFAIGAECTHYHGPLAEGLMVGDTVRCPWHHACFSLRTGEALRAPALAPVECWITERRDGKVLVLGKAASPQATRATSAAAAPQKIVIV